MIDDRVDVIHAKLSLKAQDDVRQALFDNGVVIDTDTLNSQILSVVYAAVIQAQEQAFGNGYALACVDYGVGYSKVEEMWNSNV